MVMTSIPVVVNWNGGLTLTPSTADVEAATSSHVLTFSPHGDLIAAESEGNFDRVIWERVVEFAERASRQSKESYSTTVPKQGPNLVVQLKPLIQKRVVQEENWKQIGR